MVNTFRRLQQQQKLITYRIVIVVVVIAVAIIVVVVVVIVVRSEKRRFHRNFRFCLTFIIKTSGFKRKIINISCDKLFCGSRSTLTQNKTETNELKKQKEICPKESEFHSVHKTQKKSETPKYSVFAFENIEFCDEIFTHKISNL